jgi:hypothetical protein
LGLETRVADRTRDLQIAAQSIRRAASILSPDQLPQVVELTKNSFELYHAHIYLYDPGRGIWCWQPGPVKLGILCRSWSPHSGWRAQPGGSNPARDAHAVIVTDVKADLTFVDPLLPDTRSEAALPLTVSDRVIRVLDVQSNRWAGLMKP